jgi:hypothetical protein
MLQPHPLAGEAGRNSGARTLEQGAIEPNLQTTGSRIGNVSTGSAGNANGGPARIRTWDQRIMSSENGDDDGQ